MVESNWDLLRKTIKAGKTDEALQSMEQGLGTATMQQNSSVSFVGMAVTYLAQTFGEEHLEKFYRQRYLPMSKQWIEATPGAKESVERFSTLMESPYSKITLKDEPDRYALALDPCRTGGRLRRSVSAGPFKLASTSVGTNKKAYPWTWGRTGICYYCIHSAFLFEILPIELRGYPIAVIQYADNPQDPCVLYFYKKPELIPEKYFTRVGKVKKIK